MNCSCITSSSNPSPVFTLSTTLRDGETAWDGVTAPAAVKNLREMKPGTKWIFYHTGDERTAVGTGTVISVTPPTPRFPLFASRRANTSRTQRLSPKSRREKSSPAHRCCLSAGSRSFRSRKSSGTGLWRDLREAVDRETRILNDPSDRRRRDVIRAPPLQVATRFCRRPHSALVPGLCRRPMRRRKGRPSRRPCRWRRCPLHRLRPA